MTRMRRRTAGVLLAACLIVGAGCSTPSRTVTTTETRECTPADAEGERECHTVSIETTTSEPEVHDGCDGILSCGLGAVGQVVALPFRILGLVLDVVF